MMLTTINERVEYLLFQYSGCDLILNSLFIYILHSNLNKTTLPVSVVPMEGATTTTPMLWSEVVTELYQWTFMFQVIRHT